MATHSSVLAWEIPWTEEPGRLQSMGLKRVRYNLVTKQLQVIFSLAFIWVYKSQLLVVGLMDMSLSKLQEMVCWSLWGHKELDTTTTMCGLIRQRHCVQFTHRLLKENVRFTGNRQCSEQPDPPVFDV